MNYKIIAVLVTYNPNPEYLLKNIESIIDDVEKIIICNNSKGEIIDIVNFSEEQLKKIDTLDFFDNLGIAKAQNIGMKKAYENGADFILQMDQDTILSDNAVIKMKDSFLKLKDNNVNVGIIGGCTSKNIKIKTSEKMKKRVIEIEGNYYKKIRALISSGSLISREAYEKIGDMMTELFIDHVDTEYCWRMKKYGFEVVQDLQVYMEHQVGSGTINYKGRDYLISSPIRNYYQIRNSLYLLKCGHAPISWKKNEIKIILRHLYIFPKIMDNGDLRKKYMIKGIKDFFKGKMGKIDIEIES